MCWMISQGMEDIVCKFCGGEYLVLLGFRGSDVERPQIRIAVWVHSDGVALELWPQEAEQKSES